MYMQCIPDFNILDMSASGDEETVELVASTMNSVVDIIVLFIDCCILTYYYCQKTGALYGYALQEDEPFPYGVKHQFYHLVSLVRFLLRFCQLDFAISWNLAKDYSNELNLSMQVLHTLPGKPSPWLIGTPNKLLNLSGTFLL